MKTYIKNYLAAVLVLVAFNVNAQLQLPQPSPKASVSQTIGLTDVSVEYSSPAVKGRTIWGALVPYELVWRAGANAPTKITFSKDVTINKVSVPKGSYSFFVIPTKGDWTLILNKDVNASADEYKDSEDMVRVSVRPETIPSRERLTYLFSNFNDNQGSLDMEWEKVRVSLPISFGTAEQAKANIKSSLGSTWRTYNSAARYMMDQRDYDTGLTYVNQSLSLSNEWYNNWTKAQLLAAKGDYKQALQFAATAKELGDKNPDGFFFKPQVEQSLVDWKSK